MMSSTIIPSAKPPLIAHPDRADAGAADLGVQVAGERTQPGDDRRCLAQRPLGELAGDAQPQRIDRAM